MEEWVDGALVIPYELKSLHELSLALYLGYRRVVWQTIQKPKRNRNPFQVFGQFIFPTDMIS